MRGLLAAAGVLLVAVAGCGSGEPARWAGPQRVELNWHENCGTRADPIPIETRRLIVRRNRWQVDVAFRNETHVALWLAEAHLPDKRYFGIDAFRTASQEELRRRAEGYALKPGALADRFTPTKPGLLLPGDRWSGSFSGHGWLPAEKPLRVVLGRFVITDTPPPALPRGFLCVSDRVVRLK